MHLASMAGHDALHDEQAHAIARGGRLLRGASAVVDVDMDAISRAPDRDADDTAWTDDTAGVLQQVGKGAMQQQGIAAHDGATADHDLQSPLEGQTDAVGRLTYHPAEVHRFVLGGDEDAGDHVRDSLQLLGHLPEPLVIARRESRGLVQLCQHRVDSGKGLPHVMTQLTGAEGGLHVWAGTREPAAGGSTVDCPTLALTRLKTPEQALQVREVDQPRA